MEDQQWNRKSREGIRVCLYKILFFYKQTLALCVQHIWKRILLIGGAWHPLLRELQLMDLMPDIKIMICVPQQITCFVDFTQPSLFTHNMIIVGVWEQE
jgi:hypothetical protein